MSNWVTSLAEKVAYSGAVVRVVVIRASGSTPREAGAAMIVTAREVEGTIGGGTLELEAIAAARAMLGVVEKTDAPMWHRETRDYPLGPSLGQCCGGAAKLLFEMYGPAEVSFVGEAAGLQGPGLVLRAIETGTPLRVLTHRKDGYPDLPLSAVRLTRDFLSGARPAAATFLPRTKHANAQFVEPLSQKRTPLYLYGAGHVGQAMVKVFRDLPFAVTWIDTSEDRFPAEKTPSVTRISTLDPASAAEGAPSDAFHLVMTYSHPLDLAICHAILKADLFGFLGLIGSRTKRARFIKRLRELGHDDRSLQRLVCPIGIPGLQGKEPATIAVSTAAQLLVALQVKSAAGLPGFGEVPL